MVYLKDEVLDLVFHALADRTRRDILSRLAERECGINELAKTYQMTLAAVSKHIRVLESAGLVVKTKEGRVYRCIMKFEPLQVAVDQIEFYRKYWSRQLDGLDKYVRTVTAKANSTQKGRNPNGKQKDA